MDRIEKTIQFTPEDLQRAYSIHFRKINPIRSKVVLILGSILVLLGIMLLVMQILAGIITWISWICVLYGLIILAYYYWQFRRMGKAAFKKLSDFHNPFTYIISSGEIKTTGKNVTSQNSMDHYQFALITPQMILLYPNKLRFVMLPKKYFTDEEYSQIAGWLRAKVKCKQ